MSKMKAIQAPRDIEYVPIYEPDMERMVKALKIVLAIPKRKGDGTDGCSADAEETTSKVDDRGIRREEPGTQRVPANT